MEHDIFAELAKKYFQYLIADYGFSVVHESYYPQAFGDSLVQFQSNTTVVLLTRDKGQVLIDLGPSSEPRIAWHSLSNIIDFLAPGIGKSVFAFPDYPGEPEKSMQVQLSRLAPILRQY